ncbi:hypothetical protein EKO27_g3815 [Xylaria grammica]|uniref:Ketoreductase domain-containing protein n=1 Tax=Xylaria grammica TaxID=363999 RepID=A0A439DA70_9PEZI|nr:hypothetical protein EKO27_g3815 [Xylaria grammica]
MSPKTVLITGCSDGGIGAALAAEFQLRGLRVFATARDPAKMASIAALGIETLALDVTSDASIEQAVATVREKLNHSSNGASKSTTTEQETGKRLDLLVNNAGMNHVMPLSDTKIADLRALFNTNVVGSLAVTQAFIPLLMHQRAPNAESSKDGKTKSTVAMLGSVNEVFSPPYQAAYNASKVAVHAVARTLRVELAPLGINCVTLMTGSVRTKLFENAPSKVPENSLYGALADRIENREFLKNAQWVEAEEFARQVVDDLLKPKPKLDIWRGGLARVASWLAVFGWEGMLDSAILKANHLDEI